MFRAFVIAASLYSAGAPQFAEYRPDFLDLPLKNLHHDVNRSADEVIAAAGMFKIAYPLNRMNSMLRFSEQVLERTGYPMRDRKHTISEQENRENWALLLEEFTK